MTRLVLGLDPVDLTLRLAWGGGWVQSFAIEGPRPLEDGDVVSLKFYVVDSEDAPLISEWVATLDDDGRNGRWEHDPADVLTLLHAQVRVVRMICTRASGMPLVWGGGGVVKK